MGQGAHYVGQLSQLLYKKKLKKGSFTNDVIGLGRRGFDEDEVIFTTIFGPRTNVVWNVPP